MLNENNLGGLRVLYPRVIETAEALTAEQRMKQSRICAKLLEKADGNDKTWLVNYKDCLDLFSVDREMANRASFAASKFAPSFISPEYCFNVRNPKTATQKKGGKK